MKKNEIKNKLMSVITIIALYMIVGFSANNLMAQPPNCNVVCHGQWSAVKKVTIDVPEDGFCKADFHYRTKQCDSCTFEVEIPPPVEFHSCYLVDAINENIHLARHYTNKAYEALTNGMALDFMRVTGCECIEFKTTSLDGCFARCSFRYSYIPYPDPDPANPIKDTAHWTYVNWTVCLADGCCIRTNKVCYKNGVLTNQVSVEQAPVSHCPPNPPPNLPPNACQSMFDVYNNYIREGRPIGGRIYTRTINFFQRHCETMCR